MRKNMALSKIQHHRIRLWIHNQAYIMCKRGTTFRENRNPTPMKSSTCTDEARFTVQVGFEKTSPGEFGLIGMILVISGFASAIADAGLGASITQKQRLSDRALDSVFWLNIAFGER
jgi:hypothetical protein